MRVLASAALTWAAIHVLSGNGDGVVASDASTSGASTLLRRPRALQACVPTNETVELDLLLTGCVTQAVLDASPAINDINGMLYMIERAAGLDGMNVFWRTPSSCNDDRTANRMYLSVPCPVCSDELVVSSLDGRSVQLDASPGFNVMQTMLLLLGKEEDRGNTPARIVNGFRLAWAIEREVAAGRAVPINALGYNLTMVRLVIRGPNGVQDIPLSQSAPREEIDPNSANSTAPKTILNIVTATVGALVFVILLGLWLSLRQQGGFVSLAGGNKFDKFIKGNGRDPVLAGGSSGPGSPRPAVSPGKGPGSAGKRALTSGQRSLSAGFLSPGKGIPVAVRAKKPITEVVMDTLFGKSFTVRAPGAPPPPPPGSPASKSGSVRNLFGAASPGSAFSASMASLASLTGVQAAAATTSSGSAAGSSEAAGVGPGTPQAGPGFRPPMLRQQSSSGYNKGPMAGLKSSRIAPAPSTPA